MGRSRSLSRSRSPIRRKRAKERDERSSRRHRRSRSKSREKRRTSGSRSKGTYRSGGGIERDRSRSYERKRQHHSPPTASPKSKMHSAPNTSYSSVSDANLAGKSSDEIEMMKIMGFCDFDTTKGKKVEGNNVGEVHVILKRKYRQYMNRKGGFNRPLDFVA